MTLSDLARTHGLGLEEIEIANPEIDSWLPPVGAEVVLPTGFILPPVRHGIVVNLPEFRLYRFGDGGAPQTYPVGIGREGWATPTGVTRIERKRAAPTWRPPQSIRDEHAADGDPLPEVVPPGPDNPLGAFAIDLGLTGYLIHGTNKPLGVGKRVSHGCIRLYPEDIEQLFAEVEPGMPVTLLDRPYKAGWHGERLYLEVHPPLARADATPEPASHSGAVAALIAATTEHAADIDWGRVRRTINEMKGVPVAVGRLRKEITAALPTASGGSPARD